MKTAPMIDRIIATESLKSYLAFNPRTETGKPKYKAFRAYSLNAAALEALATKKAYNAREITAEELKAYCLKYVITHRNDTPSPQALHMMQTAEERKNMKIYIY